jgi:Na+-translocating ferredoxin:NAD+ oxidoreductase subunit B
MTTSALLSSALILGGVGTVFALVIALAQRRFYVWEDPRIEAVAGMLPGANCGACGQVGCRSFAEHLVARETEPATCTVLSADDRQDLAAYLGVAVGAATRRVARLSCAGGCDVAPARAEYVGLQTCRSAAAVAGGAKACTWGCLGLADCVRSCTFDAMFMNPVGLPVVIPDRCTACGDCVEACPKDLYTLMPDTQHLIVQCRSLLEGGDAEAVCAVACTACGKCAVDAAPGLIAMRQGLAVIDYARNVEATAGAAARCPTGAIVWVTGRQFDAPAAEEGTLQ